MTRTPSRVRTILYVANSGKIGGANRVLTDLIEQLDRTRFRPVLAVPAEGQLKEWAVARATAVHLVPPASADLSSSLRRAWRLVRLIRSTGAAIVHTIDPVCYREASWASLITGTKRVCHIQFPSTPDMLRWVFRVRPHFTISCYRGHVAEMLREVPFLEGVALAIPNAVRVDSFVELDDTDTASRWKFGRRRMVLIVGHLSDIKGHPTFVRAASMISQTQPDCAFVALGGETVQPGFQKELEALAEKLGVAADLHFLGWRDNVAEIVRAADVFVLPSRQEGLPLALLEAMASGIPVVATPVNGVPEVVQDEQNGLLVPVDDSTRLASAVVDLLRDPLKARRLATNGRQTVVREFNMATFMNRMQHVYDSLTSDRRSRRRGGAARLPANGGLPETVGGSSA